MFKAILIVAAATAVIFSAGFTGLMIFIHFIVEKFSPRNF